MKHHDDFGPWFGRDREEVKRAYIRHVRAGRPPEEFPGVLPAVKPRTDVTFQVIYDDVSVDVEKRDGLRLPCNLCGTKNKFHGKGLLIHDELGWAHLGGADCGKKHFGDARFVSALSEFQRRKDEQLAKEFLFEAIDGVSEWLAFGRALEPIVQQADEAIATLARQQTLFRVLKNAAEKQDGQLLVHQTEMRMQQDGRTIPVEVPRTVARIAGGRALRSAKPVNGKRLSEALALLDVIGDDHDEFFETMSRSEDEGTIVKLANKYREKISAIREAHTWMLDAQTFFSNGNMGELKKFGTHPECNTPFGVEIGESTCRLLPPIQKAEAKRIRVDLITGPLPTMPTSLTGPSSKNGR